MHCLDAVEVNEDFTIHVFAIGESSAHLLWDAPYILVVQGLLLMMFYEFMEEQ